MRIAQRYLDEIEQICEGEICDDQDKYDVSDIESAREVVKAHWDLPALHGGLFSYCAPNGSPIYGCGCLTQVKSRRLHAWTDILTLQIRNDSRVADGEEHILPPHLQSLTYPLTDSQKQEIRECLYPYAEWQTRLRLEFNDAPGIEGEIVEVGA